MAKRVLWWLAAVAGMVAVCAPAAAAAGSGLQIEVLSTRADLVSGGSALTAIALPAGVDPGSVSVRLNGDDVTSQFAERPDGRFEALLSGLVNGSNEVVANAPGQPPARATVIDHPYGGRAVQQVRGHHLRLHARHRPGGRERADRAGRLLERVPVLQPVEPAVGEPDRHRHD
jgi:hypothetical protein